MLCEMCAKMVSHVCAHGDAEDTTQHAQTTNSEREAHKYGTQSVRCVCVYVLTQCTTSASRRRRCFVDKDEDDVVDDDPSLCILSESTGLLHVPALPIHALSGTYVLVRCSAYVRIHVQLCSNINNCRFRTRDLPPDHPVFIIRVLNSNTIDLDDHPT